MLVYTRASNIGKESHGKMAATTCAPVLMPRWANTNVYPSKHSLYFSFLAYLGSCFEYFFF